MSCNIDTIYKSKSKIKVRKPKDYKVIMYNDDYTTMEFVVDILVSIFDKSYPEAEKIMLDVHKRGKGIAGIYSYDIAATKVRTAINKARENDFPFKLTIEEA